jgi:peptidoglycan/LPS O-acetylase OafA/YrhL
LRWRPGGWCCSHSFALAATGIGLAAAAAAEVSYRTVEAPIREFGHRLSKRFAARAVEDSQSIVPFLVSNEGELKVSARVNA